MQTAERHDYIPHGHDGPFHRLTKVSRPLARDAGVAGSHDIVALAHADRQTVFRQLGASPDGLASDEAAARLEAVGPNVIGRRRAPALRANSLIAP